MTEITEITVVHKDYIDLDRPLEDVIENLKEIRDDIDVRYRSSASLSIESDYDSSTGFGLVRYSRPRTEEEARVEAERQAQYQKSIEDYQRKQYEDLKAKFG